MKKSSKEIKLRTLVCIEPMAIPLNKSGVTTCPLDGVTFIVMNYEYFKYLNKIF
jgi:hypothetical protein